MRDFIRGMYQKKNFTKRLIAVILAVITIGFAISLLVLVDMGTDPCTGMNIAIAEKLGMSFGTWQALLNAILFVFVILWGREYIGFGTLANMLLVGYSVDFFSWVWEEVLPVGFFDSMGVKVTVLVPALAVFVFAAAVYMDVELGTAPYDAIPLMISKRLPKVSFRWIRMAYDFLIIMIGLVLGGTVGVVTVLMALTLGPVIGWVGEKLKEKWEIVD